MALHVSDGVLSPWAAGVGFLASSALVGLGLRGVEAEDLPRMGVVGAFLFAVSSVRVPVGPSSVHLNMYGLGALPLGSRVFPLALVVLALQAVLLQFGGLLSLGSSVLNLSLPAYLATGLFRAVGPKGEGGQVGPGVSLRIPLGPGKRIHGGRVPPPVRPALIEEIVLFLARLRVPWKISALLWLCFRYLELVGSDLERTTSAMALRGGRISATPSGLRDLTLLVSKSLDESQRRAQRVAEAAEMRGFNELAWKEVSGGG